MTLQEIVTVDIKEKEKKASKETICYIAYILIKVLIRMIENIYQNHSCHPSKVQ